MFVIKYCSMIDAQKNPAICVLNPILLTLSEMFKSMANDDFISTICSYFSILVACGIRFRK